MFLYFDRMIHVLSILESMIGIYSDLLFPMILYYDIMIYNSLEKF